MKRWRVSIDTSGIEEADTEEEALKQFVEGLDVHDCDVELEDEDGEEEADEEETEEDDDESDD